MKHRKSNTLLVFLGELLQPSLELSSSKNWEGKVNSPQP